MADRKFSYHETPGAPLKLWDSDKPFEEEAMQQLRNTAALPFIHKHVAGMPDVHWGMGATIGSVVATRGAIVPSIVGVDIGCGMMAQPTSLTANDLPDNLREIRNDIERTIPTGFQKRSSNSRDRIVIAEKFVASGLMGRWANIVEKHPILKKKDEKILTQTGTLGGGNHFIEICLDEDDKVWIMLHSGSRGIGNIIGMYFINRAKEEMEKWHIAPNLPDANLSYFVEHTENFDDYIEAMTWAQDYALLNRVVMMNLILKSLEHHLPPFHLTGEMAINCHHNYATQENHFGANVWITRKGAVRAREGDLGIIPGSMGTGSFIVRGLGNPDSFCSCSHGAGRVMSRTKAKQLISEEQHIEAMQGIEARLDKGVLDESPAAYKDINAVMDAQTDLVEIVHRLRQVVNVKG